MIKYHAIERIREENRRLLKLELRRITKKLIQMGAIKIILFGSAAKGSAGIWSDLDLVVVFADSKNDFITRVTDLYRDVKPRVAADILVYTALEFKAMSESNSFIKHILKEGKVLYEKGA